MAWVIVVTVLGGWVGIVCGLVVSIASAVQPDALPHRGGGPVNPALTMLAGIALMAFGTCSVLCGAKAAWCIEVERAAQSAAARAAKEGE